MIGQGYRPCGACGALVSATSGCMHWRPYLAAYEREDPVTVRAKLNRRYAENARLQATQAVAQFRRMMTRGVTG